MLNKLLANLLVRKAIVFSGALAVAIAVMGGNLANHYEAESVRELMAYVPVSTVTSPSGQIAFTMQSYAPSEHEDSLWDAGAPVAAVLHPGGSAYTEDRTPRVLDETALTDEGYGEAAVPSESSAGQEQFAYCDQIPLSRDLQEYTYGQCLLYDLDYELVLALMWRESRFQPDAVNINVNGTQDSGIMQINDVNRGWLAADLGITDLMDPKQNIAAGTAILGKFKKKYGEHNALLAYQYGEAGMERKLNQGVTTNNQVQLLYTKKADFEALLSS